MRGLTAKMRLVSNEHSHKHCTHDVRQIWEKYDPESEAAAAGESGEGDANGSAGGETLEVVVTEVRFCLAPKDCATGTWRRRRDAGCGRRHGRSPLFLPASAFR